MPHDAFRPGRARRGTLSDALMLVARGGRSLQCGRTRRAVRSHPEGVSGASPE